MREVISYFRVKGIDYFRYGAALVAVAACLCATFLLERYGLSTPNVVMFFVLVVALVAARFGTGPSIVASVASGILLAYFFLPPLMSIAVSDFQHVTMLIVMCLIALLISRLTDQVRAQAKAAESHAERAESLYRLGETLAASHGAAALAAAATRHAQGALDGAVLLLYADQPGELRVVGRTPDDADLSASDMSDVERILREQRISTEMLVCSHGSGRFSVPLPFGAPSLGALYWLAQGAQSTLDADQSQLLVAFARQIAAAIERDRLAGEVQKVELRAETERLRAALLSSVTHDLRTPLAVIAGASSSLLESGADLSSDVRDELCQTIFADAQRMNRLVDSLLTMTRVEAGVLRVNKQLHFLDDVIGAALRLMKSSWATRPVEIDLAEDLPMVPMDDVLVQQVLLNVFDNIQKYTPRDSLVCIRAFTFAPYCVLTVADSGHGIPRGDEDRIFEKFYRGKQVQHGSGLGLTVCRAVLTAHGGRISARNLPGKGAEIRIELMLAPTSLPPGEPLHVATSDASVGPVVEASRHPPHCE